MGKIKKVYPMKFMPFNRAFTLIELLVVIAIVGILSGFIFVSMQGAINAANDVFTWSQLDSSAKLSIATTSTNSISGNIVVDPVSFFGTTVNAASNTAVAVQGLMGLSRNKTKIAFALRFLDNVPDGATTTTSDRWIKGQGYITGLAPKVSADQPVWVTPFTISVTGEFLIAETTAT
jgi:prepilin-type N-terminal cleavage/methylation domain-containing protein